MVKTLIPLICVWCFPYHQFFVWRQLELTFFSAVTPVAALFYMLTGGYMSKNIPKKVIDITGIEFTPGQPAVCLGNGAQGFECCCDECDYYLICFPEFDPKKQRLTPTDF